MQRRFTLEIKRDATAHHASRRVATVAAAVTAAAAAARAQMGTRADEHMCGRARAQISTRADEHARGRARTRTSTHGRTDYVCVCKQCESLCGRTSRARPAPEGRSLPPVSCSCRSARTPRTTLNSEMMSITRSPSSFVSHSSSSINRRPYCKGSWARGEGTRTAARELHALRGSRDARKTCSGLVGRFNCLRARPPALQQRAVRLVDLLALLGQPDWWDLSRAGAAKCELSMSAPWANTWG